MGIKTVAVYSEADAYAMFVEQADEAGPAPSAHSYLSIPSIIEAVQRTKADAVHPGYGFLSENSKFCSALSAISCAFIGPSTQSMGAMGDKLESKRIATKARVHIIPGHQGVIESADEARSIAERLGYPVMLKASAGGGGKGMRIAFSEADLPEAFKLATAEAQSSFADSRLLIERFIEEPRHVEFQLLGDQHGNVIYLPERECSIQRRNQKVIEEAPSPFLSPHIRSQMGEQAVRLAKAVGYYSAGTVEFLMDKHKNFYFLEMNTRLQVEHPITELVSGFDLVEQMILIAQGHALQYKQSDVKINGWAIESRVYAEDPKRFLPSIGTLERYIEPEGPGVRCDSGVRESSEISVYYDPMICKLSTHGADRLEAIHRMESALDKYVIRGVTHNIPLLRQVISDPIFQSGQYSTKYLAEYYPNGFDGHELTEQQEINLDAIYSFIFLKDYESKMLLNKKVEIPRLYCTVRGSTREVHVISSSEFKIANELYRVTSDWDGSSVIVNIRVNDTNYTIQYCRESPQSITFMASEYQVDLETEQEFQLRKLLPKRLQSSSSTSASQIIAPMPGLIVSMAVQAGDVVKEGAEVAVMEAMKMQNVLRAPIAGKVIKVHATKGDTVGNRQLLIDLEPINDH